MAMTTLQALGPDLWTATSTMRFPGGVILPVRMTAIRLVDGGVALISPLPLDDALAAEVAGLGPVRYLIGPSLTHHLSLSAARERFPSATLLGAPGLPDKRRDLPFGGTLDDARFAEPLGAYLIGGAPRLSEVVFHHPASRTLVATDLVFNITAPVNRRTALLLTMMGTRGRLARSRAWAFFIRDRAAYRESVDRILALPFDRVVMAHGEVVESDARDALARALLRA
jgi:hypothetical protein